MAYLYIIKGVQEFYYCGITQDIYKRYRAHNTGQGKSTRRNSPYVIKYLFEIESMSRARILEKIIKNQGVRKWLYKQTGKLSTHYSNKKIELFNHTIRQRAAI